MWVINQANIKDWARDYEGPLFDGILCDPPYELGFMGKSWDSSGIAFDTEMWADIYKLLKPGGHLLAFSGSRTYHRMAVAIEDAGFEIRDMIEWVYGSGFPKSLNIGKAVNSLETNEWSKISKALDNIDQKSIMEVWKSNAKLAGIKLSKSLTGVGSSMQKKYFVPDIAVLYPNQENKNAGAIIAELNSCVPNHTSEESLTIAVESVEQNTELSQDLVKSVIKLSQSHGVLSWSIFTAECDVKEWLKENTTVNLKVDEALKTLRGNKKYSSEEITSVLCAELTDILKLTILSQSNTFQNLDTKSQTDFLSVINVIITEYTTENLISNTVAILKSKAVDKIQGNEREYLGIDKTKVRKDNDNNNTYAKHVGQTGEITKGTSPYEGYGTALKPAHEPCVLARKPLEKGMTVANNVLKHGTGGLNIDGTRVGTETISYPNGTGGGKNEVNRMMGGNKENDTDFRSTPWSQTGRFPANLIHDGSDEVEAVFPQTGSPRKERTSKRGGSSLYGSETIGTPDKLGTWPADNGGSASRFFYTAKSSRAERNAGLDGTVSIKVQLEICENNTTRQENLAQLQVVMDSSHLKATAESGIGTKSGTEWSMSLFGSQYTEKYLPSTKSTTSTTTSSITTSAILNYLTGLLTNESTLGVSLEMANGGNHANDVESSSTLAATISDQTALVLGASPAQASKRLLISVSDGKNFHSTVKPLSLTKYLATLIKPPTGGRLLVPFSGSGSEMVGALQAGWGEVIGVELTEEYIPIAEARIKHWTKEPDQSSLL